MKGALAKHASEKVLAEALNKRVAAATTATPKKEKGEEKKPVADANFAAIAPKTEEDIVKYKFADSFTLALAYVSTLKFYASIISSKMLVRAEYLSHLIAKHPDLVVKENDNGELRYVGPTATSAIEGGNHRLKYELRVPYKDIDTFCGRAILLAVRDSMYTFRHGRPEVSFAHAHSSFSYSSVMAGGSFAAAS